jgi:hypothetical protein
MERRPEGQTSIGGTVSLADQVTHTRLPLRTLFCLRFIFNFPFLPKNSQYIPLSIDLILHRVCSK